MEQLPQNELALSVYQILQSLSRSLNHAAPEARQSLLYLALRAALHPSLAEHLEDPLLPLGNHYISLDAHIIGLIQFAKEKADADRLFACFDRQDQNRIARFGFSNLKRVKIASGDIGGIHGALYVPSQQRAVPCCVWSARLPYAAGDTIPMRWSDPIALRPVSAEIADSAKAALGAVLETLQRAIKLPAPVLPTLMYYDFSAPELSADSVASTAGDSLGLPLALSFLSALTEIPLQPNVAATGAVGRLDRARAIVSPVGWVMEKMAAVAPSVDRMLIPTTDTDTLFSLPNIRAIPVATVQDAAVHAANGFQTMLVSPQEMGRGRDTPQPPVNAALCFVYIAISDATRFWESAPVAMRQTVHELDRLVQQHSRVRDGYLFRQDTDDAGLSLAFPTVRDGCAAALAIQQAALSQPWSMPLPDLLISIGVHYGQAELFQGNYSGPALGQTRRILEAAHGGQILVSDAAQQALRSEQQSENWSLTALGIHRLRDLTAPVALYQLSHAGLPDHFGPPRTLDSLRLNLPVLPSPLLARENEVASLKRLIETKKSRIITLTGIGGIGKTRLAQQVAAEVIDLFPDGVWFVSLADLERETSGAAGIADSIIEAMRLKQKGGKDAISTVREALSEKKLLLLLDNFESVLSDAVFVSDLMRHAPGVTCLVTSRSLLQIQGEQRFEVSPLSLPGESEPIEAVLISGAVTLFLARAHAANADFTFDNDALLSIVAICRRLDGLPLAIELAAARIRTMSLAEIEMGLKDTFSLLSTRLRDIPERQRTLRKTLEWSYGMLSDLESKLLMRIAVFGRDFTAEAAKPVAGLGFQTQELLERLEEQSLVQCRVEKETSRWSLLTLVQKFAVEKLRDSPDEERTRSAHAHYFHERARRSAESSDTPDEVAAFNSLAREIENLRIAYLWFRDQDIAVLPAYVLSLVAFLRQRGYWRERLEWLEAARVAAEFNDTSGSTLVQIYYEMGNLYSNRYEDGISFLWLDKAAALAEKNQERLITAKILNVRGLAERRAKDYEKAISLHTQASQLAREIGNARMEIASLVNLALATADNGDTVTAYGYYEEIIQRCEASGDLRGKTMALNNIGHMLEQNGDFEAAYHQFVRTLQASYLNSDSVLVASALLNIGESLEKLGRVDKAVPALIAAMILFERLEHPHQKVAEEYLSHCKAQYGNERADSLYREYSRQLDTFLQHVDITISP